jgi:sec-independent protein translocase protein TatA
MGFGSIGVTGFLLIVIVGLLLFGPSKLPELGRAFGKTLREFKNGTRDLMSDEEEEQRNRKEINSKSSSDEDTKDRDNNRRLPD